MDAAEGFGSPDQYSDLPWELDDFCPTGRRRKTDHAQMHKILSLRDKDFNPGVWRVVLCLVDLEPGQMDSKHLSHTDLCPLHHQSDLLAYKKGQRSPVPEN